MDRVVHFHIPVDDMKRARKFYESVFDWKIEETGIGRNYHLVKTVDADEMGVPKEPGAINGALFMRDEYAKAPSVVIAVDSIDEYIEKIEKKGGSVVLPKAPVEDFGMFAEISDTEGNVIGLWETLMYCTEESCGLK